MLNKGFYKILRFRYITEGGDDQTFLFQISRRAMAEEGPNGAGEQPKAAVHIVHVLREDGIDPEAHHVRTLASVLGSEEAARAALVYSYKTAVSGFSAKLTPQQVDEISSMFPRLPAAIVQVFPHQMQCALNSWKEPRILTVSRSYPRI
ncbi:unnamed protein product [Spirodela intermedia]|uniref:Inhibitor I9 domain-containing protein n=1 Tax=Spirodela intermedia TaxID=51605 RepID=A0A7I8KPZ7_SPIIN|nr:unnamed protein product [Spirodela intermedia]